ncbi:MAG: hypothetical protein JW845_06035 [Dehalococcoidales bacterium]|nr:hypothetical protein [Dehalococcoidales bacterium]
MWQNFLNIITVLGFIIAILTWFKITPERLGQITKRYVIKNWYIVVAITFTCLDIILIVLNIISKNYNWWSYAEAFWTPIFLWLVIWVRAEVQRNRLLERIIVFAPVMFLFTSWGRLVNALNTGVFDNTSPSFDKWLTLGICGYYVFIVGIFIGLNIFFLFFEKRLDESNKLILKTKETFDKVTILEEVLKSKLNESGPNQKK